MKTFANIKELVENPGFPDQREASLHSLSSAVIDAPITEIVKGFAMLLYCFTLQCCHGHFIFRGRYNTHSIEPLPITDTIESVEYRIAYVAFCIENSEQGREFLERLKQIPLIDPENIQFCCAEWFWKKQVNSYALQVEPARFKDRDSAIIDYCEALQVEKIRNEFFVALDKLLQEYKVQEDGKIY